MPGNVSPGKRFSSIADLCDIFEKNRQNEPAVSSCTGRARSGLFSQRAEIAAFFACLPLFRASAGLPALLRSVLISKSVAFPYSGHKELEGFREKPECIKKDICAKFNHPGYLAKHYLSIGLSDTGSQFDRQTGQDPRKNLLFAVTSKE